jgi:hypothetical protein
MEISVLSKRPKDDIISVEHARHYTVKVLACFHRNQIQICLWFILIITFIVSIFIVSAHVPCHEIQGENPRQNRSSPAQDAYQCLSPAYKDLYVRKFLFLRHFSAVVYPRRCLHSEEYPDRTVVYLYLVACLW